MWLCHIPFSSFPLFFYFDYLQTLWCLSIYSMFLIPLPTTFVTPSSILCHLSTFRPLSPLFLSSIFHLSLTTYLCLPTPCLSIPFYSYLPNICLLLLASLFWPCLLIILSLVTLWIIFYILQHISWSQVLTPMLLSSITHTPHSVLPTLHL